MKGGIQLRGEEQGKACLMPVRDTRSKVPVAMLSVIFLACLFFASPAIGQSAKEPAGKLRTLTTAREAHDLTSEEAARGYPVHLRGVVTYYDPSIGSKRAVLFVHDATGGIYAELVEGSIEDLTPGTLVDVRGVSGAGEFAPIVNHPQIKVIGHAPLPANASQENLSRLKSGALDGQWIEAEGVIRSFVEYRHIVALQLVMDGGTATILIVREAGAVYSGLVDAKVRVRANAGPTFNRTLQMIGVRLFCPGLSAITIVEAPQNDPFNLPIISVDTLLRWDQVSDSLHRVHLRGTVTLQWPGASLCIHDATRGICAQTAQNTPVAEGDDVDVVGFVAVQGSAPVLTDAVFRWRSNGKPVAAEFVTAEQILLGRYDSEPVQIDGQLDAIDTATSDTTLLLASGKNIFAAILPKALAGREADAWKIGSVLHVTGICSVQLDEQRSAIGEGMAVPKSFRILMRTPQDVIVLKRPSWWTPVHALVLLALALAVTLLVLAWVVVLRKRVDEQTHLLRKSEELFRHMALHDSLTGLAARPLLQDRLNVGVEAAKRHKTGLALLMVDIDRFKQTNDTYGHQAGDEVLRMAAQHLLQAVRKTDTVARIGGDEFVVLLSDLSNPRMAEEIAANIVATLAVPVHFAGGEVPVSASVGVCTALAEDLDVDFLLKNADAALYQAKAKGRNCFYVFTPSQHRTKTESIA